MDTTLGELLANPLISTLLGSLILALAGQTLWVVRTLRRVLVILVGADGDNGLRSDVRKLREDMRQAEARRLEDAVEEGRTAVRLEEHERRLTILEKVAAPRHVPTAGGPS